MSSTTTNNGNQKTVFDERIEAIEILDAINEKIGDAAECIGFIYARLKKERSPRALWSGSPVISHSIGKRTVAIRFDTAHDSVDLRVPRSDINRVCQATKPVDQISIAREIVDEIIATEDAHFLSLVSIRWDIDLKLPYGNRVSSVKASDPEEKIRHMLETEMPSLKSIVYEVKIDGTTLTLISKTDGCIGTTKYKTGDVIAAFQVIIKKEICE